jgi:hypothetical protein
MYKYYYCDKINDEIFNNKITIDKFNDLIEKYKLVCKDKVKEYWINNVMILSNNSNLTFNKVIDKEILFDNNYLIQELVMSECKPFNFHKTDLELEYILYENIIDNIKIILKKYNDYITLEYETDNLINIDNFLY